MNQAITQVKINLDNKKAAPLRAALIKESE
jgi:hypothetical protein